MKQQYDSYELYRATLNMNHKQKREHVISELKEFSNIHQEDILNELYNFRKIDLVHSINNLWIANVINCYATPSVIRQLSNHSDVKSID